MNAEQLEECRISDNDLQKFNCFITVKEQYSYTFHYNAVLNYFIDDLRVHDKIFKAIYNGHELGGSYADQLKVSKPDQFDTFIKFKLVKNNVGVSIVEDRAGYVKINVRNCNFHDKKLLTNLIDDDEYLSQYGTLHWLDEAIKASLRRLHANENDDISDYKTYNLKIGSDGTRYKLRYSTSGPAITLKVHVVDNDIKFNMDLVPAFPFPASPEFWVSDRDPPTMPDAYWLAVPKPSKDKLLTSKHNHSFITSYAWLERREIKGINHFKTLIRIFKKLRDTQNLTHLKSYFIKAIFLQHLDENRYNRNYWNQPLSKLFKIMLLKIDMHLRDEELLFYWDRNYNMLMTLDQMQRQSLQQTYTGVLRKLRRLGLAEILLTPFERQELEWRYGAVDESLSVTDAPAAQNDIWRSGILRYSLVTFVFKYFKYVALTTLTITIFFISIFYIYYLFI